MKLTLPFTIHHEEIEHLKVSWVFSKQFVTNTILISLDAGGFYESNPSLPWISQGSFHLLEHMVFQPTSTVDYIKKFHQVGATYNAFTSQLNTIYYSHFTDPNPEILLNMMRMVFDKRTFSSEKVNKEKDIIINEILSLEDDPLFKTYEIWHRFLFKRCPVWKNPIGKRSSLNKITPAQLKNIHQLYYHPKQSRLMIVTNRDKNFWTPTLKQFFSLGNPHQSSKIDLVLPEETTISKRPYRKSCSYPYSIPFLVAGCKPINQQFTMLDKVMMDILTQTVFNGFSSILDEFVFKGYVDDSYEVDVQCEKEFGYWALSGYSDYPFEMSELILKEIRKRLASGFTKEEFSIMKTHFLTNCLMQANDSMEMPFLLNHLLQFGLSNWEEYYQIIESISWQSIQESLSRFMPESQFRTLIMLPE